MDASPPPPRSKGPAVRLDILVDAVEQGGFSRAVPAQQPVDFAGFKGEGGAAQHLFLIKALFHFL